MNQGLVAQEVEFWKIVSDDLGIDVVTPFEAIFLMVRVLARPRW
jgi:hypothetical protein